MRILQLSTVDTAAGGAERVAWNLFKGFRERGHDSWLGVGSKRSEDRNVFCINRTASSQWWRRYRICRVLVDPLRYAEQYLGIENFRFPDTRRLLEHLPGQPDIIHGHNLHGGYFDLRALSFLSREVPVLLTLHDAWLLSGHCAHSFDCDRWKTGCGHCPDLSVYPAVRRDATAFNWQRKKKIYAASRICVSTPCHWLMEKVKQSILAEAAVDTRVIPYGVDLEVFRPGDKRAARAALGLPLDKKIIFFAANGIRWNLFKDFESLRKALEILSVQEGGGKGLLFLALGEDAPVERIGEAEIRFVPYQPDPAAVARFYQAADLYVHAARMETFPNSILEALACGTPVVASAVGGVPEQVKTLEREGATGVLVPARDAAALARGIDALLKDDELRSRLAFSARKDAEARFDLRRQVKDHLDWYACVARV